jgi:hypothetical protein
MTKQAIQIQSVGRVQAKPAIEFSIGDKMVWNFGYTSEVVRVVKETKSQIIYELKSTDSGNIHERRFGKQRLVAFA